MIVLIVDESNNRSEAVKSVPSNSSIGSDNSRKYSKIKYSCFLIVLENGACFRLNIDVSR